MRFMKSSHPELTVIGSVRSVAIGQGAMVDVDQVVGSGLTLADALGAELLAGFAPVESSEVEGSSRKRPRPVAEPAPERQE